jgi:hypothetical protein
MGFELRTWSATVSLLVALVPFGSGCGGFVESNEAIARATIDDRGGTLHLEGFSLTVPAHALGHAVTLSLHRARTEAPASSAYELEPAGTTFDVAAPAEVAIHYDATSYPHLPEVFVALQQGTVWHPLPPSGASVAGEAHATTTTVGTFGVIVCPGGTCPTPGADAGTD